MFDLLEHVRDPVLTLKKAESLLKHGGILMITTPDLSRFLRSVMGKKWLHYKLEHLFYFHRSGIKRLFSQTGLKIENITTAKKAFTLAYSFHQFSIYNHFLITPVLKVFNKILPSVIRNKPFYLRLGEMNVILRKK
jgi:2-polyprenyl-3-methyl-5-hydroxy-6-metoxy-1,4-benzoquinol methylase